MDKANACCTCGKGQPNYTTARESPYRVRVCEFTGLECENGALEWNTGVEYWSIQTKCL